MEKSDLTRLPLTEVLGKPSHEFTKADMMRLAKEHDIRMVNFMYSASDGRLKTLNFVITDSNYLGEILGSGERVDGSSLFPFIEAESSDLYAVPRFRTAFIDQTAPRTTLCFLCSFFDKEGRRMESSPEYLLEKACAAFTATTGLRFEAMGELEYYVVADATPELMSFPVADQRGYHESAPFAKFNDFRTECMHHIALAGGMVKYGHSEVGNFTLGGRVWEQNEIEFLPTDPCLAADQLVIAKWLIRNLARQYGYQVSFAPKITEGKAGSGLHVHMRVMKDGKNLMLDPAGKLSDDARRMIAGLIDLAPSITAFGNTNPTSYFRLVPHQEAPTNICWGDRNRSVLIRVPLGWTAGRDMSCQVNPLEERAQEDASSKQTVEIRSADGSADVYQLLAAVAVAARHGFQMPDALQVARDTYVDINIHSGQYCSGIWAPAQLPTCCADSAVRLAHQRDIYQQGNVFEPRIVDSTIAHLKAFEDSNIREQVRARPELMAELVEKYFHCG